MSGLSAGPPSGPPPPPANLVQTAGSANDPMLAHIMFRMASDWSYAAQHFPQYIRQDDVEAMKALLARVERGGGGGVEVETSGQALTVAQGPSGRASPAPARPISPAYPQETLRAVWGYNGGQHDDLAFPPGAEITLLERVNPDWWRGSYQGRTGLFPSNHVESSRNSLSGPPPGYQQSPSGYGQAYPQPWQGGGGSGGGYYGAPSQDYKYQQSPVPWQQPAQQMSPPQAQPPQAQAQAQAQAPPAARPTMETHGITSTLTGNESKTSKFGKQFGTTVANGFAWGVGMDLAGEIVHKIF